MKSKRHHYQTVLCNWRKLIAGHIASRQAVKGAFVSSVREFRDLRDVVEEEELRIIPELPATVIRLRVAHLPVRGFLGWIRKPVAHLEPFLSLTSSTTDTKLTARMAWFFVLGIVVFALGRELR